ncbi:MAG: hypothetical protein EOO28_24350 [Comamonadaceae bacterium]|nr:MAG: hypothetical protein EOO28_24350 [Comamonadaceae bacterium]
MASLHRIRAHSFTATSPPDQGCNGQGTGNVRLASPGPGVLVFHESGSWTPDGQAPLQFSNVYRWTCREQVLAGSGRCIRLEHLRHGKERPVWLVDLQARSAGDWHCRAAYECGDDRYMLAMQLLDDDSGLRMRWSISGPMKNTELDYLYSFRV